MKIPAALHGQQDFGRQRPFSHETSGVYIVWGEGRREHNHGRVADFCPICHSIQPFELLRRGTRDRPHYQVRCTACGLGRQADPLDYHVPLKGKGCDLEALVERTHPDLKQALAGRLAMEEDLRLDPGRLKPGERAQLLYEPFVLLNPLVAERYSGEVFWDGRSLVGCVLTLLLSGVLLALGVCLPYGDLWLDAWVVIFLGGTALTLLQLRSAPDRYLRLRILPLMARALAPLRPSPDEVAAGFERARREGLLLAQKAAPSDLLGFLPRI